MYQKLPNNQVHISIGHLFQLELKESKEALTQYHNIGATALDPVKVTTLQDNLDSLIPGLVPLLLTLGICKLLKKDVSPIAIIVALFVIGIIARFFGIM